MKRSSVVTAVLLVIAFGVFGCSYMPWSDSGWATLVDGNAGLENFNPIGDANWRAENGAIVADKGKGGYLVSKNSYKDFQVRAEFWADTTTNSGVFIRCTDPNKVTATNAYEVNIYDQRPEPDYGTRAGAVCSVWPSGSPSQYSAFGKHSSRYLAAEVACDASRPGMTSAGISQRSMSSGSAPGEVSRSNSARHMSATSSVYLPASSFE